MSEHGFNPGDPFGFFAQMWKNTATGASNPFMPPLTEEEIDRKLAELKTVEQWLTMQVNLLQMTEKTLELQKAGLAALRQGLDPHMPEGGHGG
ncbi:PhaM family polyhydroxyalkanoate granule multifunctional regulatory protein [Silvimonas iriomotensis]|uniref:Uncharacterized protein n=1 Tax=Silvimonas iriomotensis TaxID=449662 RepID=A0ABQ2P6F8_9NEIS|nr:PhaM family polyhydroxyalkanoate granule multifunctional regulatory protein [Silvimonas iriomotensis]GGP19319.1 hypothetical protein GCM10010970_10020 [Silvimonas iriomotensis]